MSLRALAPELLLTILEALDSPSDLYSLIRASAPCFQVYSLSPDRILSTVLRNAIQPIALHHALAQLHVPAPPPELQHNDFGDKIDDFTDQYFQSDSFRFPTARTAVATLCRLCSRTSYFVNDYSSRAMRALGLGSEQSKASSLSSTELARLQRAFFRYELYSRVFPVNPKARGLNTDFFTGEDQYYQFLDRMEPWEVEEMSCVHHYFTCLIGRFLDDLEDQLVATVLADPERYHRQYCVFDDDRVLFDCLDLKGLDLFSDDGRDRSSDILSYLASLGSEFIYRLAVADGNQRKDMIREYGFVVSREFLPEALGFSRFRPAKTVMPDWIARIRKSYPVWRDFFTDSLELGIGPAIKTVAPVGFDDNQRRHPNLGYYLFKPSGSDDYIEIGHSLGGMSVGCPLRERAYVFWDATRILIPTVHKNLRTARHMDLKEVDVLFDRRYRGKSAEERLKGVKITRSQMKRIIREFGPVLDDSNDSDFDDYGPWMV